MYSQGFCHEHALILYVYLSNDDQESVLTVSDIAIPDPNLTFRPMRLTDFWYSTILLLIALDSRIHLLNLYLERKRRGGG